jgi:hypothetical protein
MHLTHPSLTKLGKSKSKKKFRNAEEARRHRELENSWNTLQKKWDTGSQPQPKKYEKLEYSLSSPANRSTAHIKSLGTGIGVATKSEPKIYSGTACKGIGTMHKSNAVPIFSDAEAIEIAKMRR